MLQGRQVTLWSTADGVGQGYLRSGCPLLCCDISHADAGAIVATLETDGEIRIFRGIDGTWEFVIGISTVVLVVEVKLERSLLLAVSHTEDGASGTIHVWEMPSCPVAPFCSFCWEGCALENDQRVSFSSHRGF